MVGIDPPFDQTCRGLLSAFFGKYPNPPLETTASQALAILLVSGLPLPGKAGGWAGGIVYAVGSRRCGVPNVPNLDLEEAFGATMSTIYKRAAQIRRLLDLGS
jgi:hypothetical protein